MIAVDLHWGAKKLLYTATGMTSRAHQLFEVDLPPKKDPKSGLPAVREIETIKYPDVSNYDACYCPDDSIEVCPSALAVVADLVDADVTSIQELLDGFIYIVEAEEVLAG